VPVPLATRSMASVCGRSLPGAAGSNIAGGIDDCLLGVLCVVRQTYLRRTVHSSRGVLPTVVRSCVLSRNLKRMPWPNGGAVGPKTNKKVTVLILT
jgi:hypothetical protein